MSKRSRRSKRSQSSAPKGTSRRRFPFWAWLLVGLVVLIPVILLAPFIAPIALIVLATSIVGLSKGSRTWLRFKSRRATAIVAASSAALLIVTGGISAAAFTKPTDSPTASGQARFADLGEVTSNSTPESPSPIPTRTSSPTRTPTPTPTPVVTTLDEVVTEEVAFEQTTVEDASIPRGQTVIAVTGQPGQRQLTYVVTQVDGVETGRELKSDVVTVAPVTQVTSVGTYDAPPPPPAVSSECDSNYADACVPIASDVDCAWGTGDGPAYFDGVARVVGSDVYGLDRNGDGFACEQ